ncbi:hypothetical protein OSB04_023951 [Centaurea solstitialis]|uniref:Uncharacterized protein n=1 Tax=Centaurea solstitialis TaxID=347529 RepID=A0AA38SK66_9ASTR|nr:hypothetical protein OSB04_023951 [Centaurea solstitialis]
MVELIERCGADVTMGKRGRTKINVDTPLSLKIRFLRKGTKVRLLDMRCLLMVSSGPPIKKRSGLRIKQAGRGSYRGS